MRVLIDSDPYAGKDAGKPSSRHGRWPCRWVSCPEAGTPPYVTAFRRRFTLPRAVTVRVHVTADERYELFLDGERIGRGPERGDAENWFFETYDLPLTVGEHVLVARVWALGDGAAFAQMSTRPGFLLSPQEDEFIPLLGTGVAEWEAKRLGGYAFTDPITAWGTGLNVVIHADQFPWGFETGAGDGWRPVATGDAGANADDANDILPLHFLSPATLPPMRDVPWTRGVVRLVSSLDGDETHAIPIRAADDLPDERAAWGRLLDGLNALVVPPHTHRRVLIDLQDYVCAYPELETTGGLGASVRVFWQEALYDDVRAQSKGNRNTVEGKYFVTAWWPRDGEGDVFLPDGGSHRTFNTLWWQCGRFIEIVVQTAADPLILDRFALHETRYPLDPEDRFQASDPRLSVVTPLAVRALQMCSHETFMDCPYYEQLQYVGDTRLQALTTYALTRDDRLPRKALRLFDASRLLNGLTQSRYPSRVRQTTRSFALWWVAMVHDYALWRDDPAFVAARMPGVRAVLDGFRRFVRPGDGLVVFAPGPNFNFMDWVPDWEGGAPPSGPDGVNAVVQWQYAWVLRQAAELEDWAGEPELAARARRQAAELAARTVDAFWDESRGLFADDPAHTHYSEHAQCLAILSDLLDETCANRVGNGLLSAPDLARTTIYFTHYLFETFHALGRGDALLDRMSLWFDLAERGLKTTVEMPEPTRSDCHAWGAHPLFHYYASLLGIRPAAPGFAQVEITPQLGPLTSASGTLPHPKGEIAVRLERNGDGLRGEIALPPGVTGTFRHDGRSVSLRGGTQGV